MTSVAKFVSLWLESVHPDNSRLVKPTVMPGVLIAAKKAMEIPATLTFLCQLPSHWTVVKKCPWLAGFLSAC